MVRRMLRARIVTALLATVLVAAAHVPGAAGSAATGGVASEERYEPILVPNMLTGYVGWSVVLRREGVGGVYGRIVPRPGERILALIIFRLAPGPVDAVRGALITSAEVGSVTVGKGPLIPTSSAPGLAFGLRVASFDIPVTGRAEASRLLSRKRLLRLGAFNVVGEPFPPYANGSQHPFSGGGYADDPLEASFWTGTESGINGACPLTAHGLPGLTPVRGSVVADVRPMAGLSGRPFLSCTDVRYQYRADELDAAVLVDATHPGVTPAAIPGTKPLRGHRGVVQSRFPGAGVVARRIPQGWLLVRGGSDPKQRLDVLAHLRAATFF
jgi:hypothetical protein